MSTPPVTQRAGWLWCLAAAVLFGAATPATKSLVDHIGSVALAGFLYLGAALAVAPFVGRSRRAAQPRQRHLLMIAVVIGGGLAPVLLVLALDRTPASTVSLLLNLELVATVLIARVFLHESLGPRAVLGITVVVAAGAVLAGTEGASFAVGALLVAGACVCWGVDNAITASLDGYAPMSITFAKGIVAGSVNIVVGVAIAGWPEWRYVSAALLVGALGYGVSISCWITGARLVGAARGQAVFALAPFIGAALSWWVHGDDLGASFAVAAVMSVAGVALLASARHTHRHHHSTVEHDHAIDASDPHHAPAAIEVLSGSLHRHLPLEHEHEHLPDIHHRHDH